jgi:hypothetical protein
VIRRYVLVISESDRSGIIQAFGPYGSEEEAERAKVAIPEALPAMACGLWDVVSCADLETEGPL